MARSHCTEEGLGMGTGLGPAQQETMGQILVLVSVQCEQYSIIYSNPLFQFLFPLLLPFPVMCSVNEP